MLKSRSTWSPGARQPSEELSEVLHDIVAQGIRASEVIGELREFLPSITRRWDRWISRSWCARCCHFVRREFEDHRVQVRVDLVEPAPAVEGRRVQWNR